ncbi:MAG: hypothetical protein HZB80_07045 [Deltaproteobacteria bacterium]|nr:hypothetical protein [Deltaproteobacteria bacterium]
MSIEKIFESRRFHVVAGLLIAISAFLVYSNTFNASFHFDDTTQIVENYSIKNLGNWVDIIRGHRGVAMLTFAINYAIGGMNVAGYHIVNLAIHIINGILVYFLIFFTLNRIDMGTDLKSVPSKAKKIAIYTAMLFAVHPIQTQAVTYIVQRMETLASMFMLIGLLLFIKGADVTTRAPAKVLLYGAVAISYVSGFYSKEVAITLPAIIFLYDYCFFANGSVRKLIPRLPIYIILIAIFVFLAAPTFTGLQETPGISTASGASAGFNVQSITPKEYLFTQFNVLIYYITLLFVPINQNLDYDFPISKGLFEVPMVKQGTVLNYPIPPAFVSLIVLMAIVGFALYLLLKRTTDNGHGQRSLIAFFILWFFIILSPTSSFVPIIDVIFEHRLYLPSVGFFFLFSLTFDQFFEYLERRTPNSKEQGLRSVKES